MTSWFTPLHARLLQLAIPGLEPADAWDAAHVFEEVRQRARQRSLWMLAAAWLGELRGLAMTAIRERRDNDNQSGPWGASNTGSPKGPRRRFDARTAVARLVTDLWHGARVLARAPVFTLVAAGSVALALTGAVCVFAMANTVLWRPLPVATDPDQLVRVFFGDDYGVWSLPDTKTIAQDAGALETAAAFSSSPIVLALPDQSPRRVFGVATVPAMLDVLGITTTRGRFFTESDDDAVVIGHGFWMREFGGSPSALGTRLNIEGRTLTIVGVMPQGLSAIDAPLEPAVWYPIERQMQNQPGTRAFGLVARLSAGSTVEQAQSELSAISAGMAEESSYFRRRDGSAHPIHVLREVDARVPPDDRTSIIAGLGGVLLLIGLVLAVACTNVGNMALARVAARRTEIAVRMSVGATRGHILSLVLAESIVLALLAGALSVVCSAAAFRWLAVTQLAADVPQGLRIAMDGRVLAFTALAALSTTLVFGLVPGLHALRSDVRADLQSGAVTTTGRRSRTRRVFIVAQMAGSAAFAILSLLFVRSVIAAHNVDLGFNPDAVAVVSIDMGSGRSATDVIRVLDERLRAEPGVADIAYALNVPLSGYRMAEGVDRVGGRQSEEPLVFAANRVSPGYFSVVGLPLTAGREFLAADGQEAVVINETLARRYWPNESAVGSTVGDATVIGIVRDAQLETVGGPVRPMLWRPFGDEPFSRVVVHARTAGDPTAMAAQLERLVASIDSSSVVEGRAMREAMTNLEQTPRLLSWSFGAAGILSTILATLGVYGMMSYTVGMRRREFGVRLALGATRDGIISHVVGEGLRTVAIGFGVGVLIAAAVATVLQSQLVGVSPFDPVSVLTCGAALGLAAVTASLIPAWRASRVDPVTVLRQ
jgi:predicted permease